MSLSIHPNEHVQVHSTPHSLPNYEQKCVNSRWHQDKLLSVILSFCECIPSHFLQFIIAMFSQQLIPTASGCHLFIFYLSSKEDFYKIINLKTERGLRHYKL